MHLTSKYIINTMKILMLMFYIKPSKSYIIMIYHNLFLKYTLLFNLIILNFLSLFFTDLLIIWLFLEISNFLFICLINLSSNNKKMIFFYFIIQIIPSFMLIYSIIMSNIIFMSPIFYNILIFSLLIKLGIPPFHWWLPILSISLPWNNLLILLTLQKIIPFYILSTLPLKTWILYSILILCSIIPPLMMLNLTNFKMLFSYSSINQSGWMILLTNLKNIIWFKYFMFYSFITLCLFSLIYWFKISMNINTYGLNFHPMIYLFALNLAGLPPFSFFYLKWYSIFMTLMNSQYFMIIIFMMMSSLITLYIYTNMMIISFYTFKIKSKMFLTTPPMKFYFLNAILISLHLSLIIWIL